jgi:hypothetical protein
LFWNVADRRGASKHQKPNRLIDKRRDEFLTGT